MPPPPPRVPTNNGSPTVVYNENEAAVAQRAREKNAMNHVLDASPRHISAARDDAGYETWLELSWEERQKVLQRIVEPKPAPTQRSINTLLPSHTHLNTDVGLYDSRDQLLYSEAIDELHGVLIQLQNERPPNLPDNHLPGKGPRPIGVRYPSYAKVCRLIFDAIREDEILFVWDLHMNPDGRLVSDACLASVEQLRKLLDIQSLHRAMQAGDLLAGVGLATLTVKEEIRAEGPAPPSHGLRSKIEAEERKAEDVLSQLQTLDLLNEELTREIAMCRGQLPNSDLSTSMAGYVALCEGKKCSLQDFLQLIDLTCPGMLRSKSLALWKSSDALPHDSVDTQTATTLLLEVARQQMIEEDELARRVARAAQMTPNLKTDTTSVFRIEAQRKGLSDVLERREKDTKGLEERLRESTERNKQLNTEMKRLEAVHAEQKRIELEAELAKQDPDTPPPEVPEFLYVKICGGWAELGPRRTRRPGKFGPKKVDGKFTLDGPVDSPTWFLGDDKAAKIVSIEGKWVVTHNDTPIVEQTGPHNGWRPHEAEAPWVVVNDLAELWTVTVKGDVEVPCQANGLCSVCSVQQGILLTHIRQNETDQTNLNNHVSSIAQRTAQIRGETEDMRYRILRYQDQVEAPPIHPGVRWGTEGAGRDTVSPPLWTGGRPQGDYDLHKLPYPDHHYEEMERIRAASRMTAVHHNLGKVRGDGPLDTQIARTYEPERLLTIHEQMSTAHPLPRGARGALPKEPVIRLSNGAVQF